MGRALIGSGGLHRLRRRRRRIYEPVESVEQGLPALYLGLPVPLRFLVLPARPILCGLAFKLRKPLAIGLSLPIAVTLCRSLACGLLCSLARLMYGLYETAR